MSKPFLYILPFFFLFYGNVWSQSDVEPLVAQLDTANGEARLVALRKLVDATTYSDPNSCLKYAEEGIELVNEQYESSKEKWKYIILFLGYRSHAYNNLEKEKESLEAIDQMFVMADSMCKEVVGPCEGRARVHGYLSTYYHKMKNYEKAIYHDKIALGIMEAMGGNTIAPLMNLGISYEAAGFPDSAIFYKKLGKKALKKIDAKQQYLTKADAEIAIAYQKAGKLDSALMLINEVIDTARKYNYALLSKTQLNGASINNEAKNYEYAWSLLQSSKSAILKSGTLENIKDWYNEASTCTKNLGMIDSAFHFSEQYVIYHDSIYELGRNESIRQAEASHEVKSKEAEIDGLTNRLGFQKSWIYLLCFLLIAVSGAFFFFFQKAKKQRAQNSLEIRYFLSGESEINSKIEIDPFLENVLKVIDENLSKPDFNVESLASKVHTSRSNLFKKIKPITGKSPVVLIREMRMQKAKLLLEKGDYAIAEIAEKVGFEDKSYFARVFKQYFGHSPSKAA